MSITRVKLELEFEIDTETGESVLISSKKISDRVKTSKSDLEPDKIFLDSNKIIFGKDVIANMHLKIDDRLSVKYEKRDGELVPIIGKDKIFKCKGGHILTKSNTISYRGESNAELAKYGDVFTIEPYLKIPGLFYLIGNNKPEQVDIPEEINIKETDDNIDISDSLDFDDMFDLDLDKEKITNINFNDINL